MGSQSQAVTEHLFTSLHSTIIENATMKLSRCVRSLTLAVESEKVFLPKYHLRVMTIKQIHRDQKESEEIDVT